MKAKNPDPQKVLFSFSTRLLDILDREHPMVKLADQIEWSGFDVAFEPMFCVDNGAPAIRTRLMVGLHYLKHAFDVSDEEVVARWVENPYWQYFCGEEYFHHKLPIHPTSMTKWRNRIKAEGLETLLEETIKAGLKMKAVTPRQAQTVVVDTTVQEKAVAFPTDARLYHKARQTLVRAALQLGLPLRQSYVRNGKYAFIAYHRYASARQYNRAKKPLKKLKTYLGRVIRDIERKLLDQPHLSKQFQELLERAKRIFHQQRHDKNKIYSVHAPEVECIAKGKVHKKYEFGCKVGLVTTAKNPFVIGISAFHDNPYDGHTLAACLTQAQRLSGADIQTVLTDQGYRGHDYTGSAAVHIVGRGFKKLTRPLRKLFKRRSSIEPVIGHAKSECRLGRNYLKGQEGDKMNAILVGCGYNLRRLLRHFLLCLQSLARIFDHPRIHTCRIAA
ncbi:MAG: IS5 family transposase [Phycisphaerae bacterium]